MARGGSFESSAEALIKQGALRRRPQDGNRTLAELFDESLAELERFHRCEYVYKAALANKLIFGRHSPSTACMQLELEVESSIADAVVFNGTSTAYEIKSEFDSTKRLKTQTADYLKVFDKVYVVTHAGFLDKLPSLVDDRVGILELKPNGSLSTKREARANAHNVDPMAVFRTLRQSEYMAACVELFGPQPELPNGIRPAHYRKLWRTLGPQEAHKALVRSMRARMTGDEDVDYVMQLPRSLRALGYSMPLSRPQRSRLISELNAKTKLSIL